MSSGDTETATGWWISTEGREPAGPWSAERVVADIRSREISANALVCEVGRTVWMALSDVAAFALAVRDAEFAARSGDVKVRLEPTFDAFDDPHEHTIVDRPVFDSSEPVVDDDGNDDAPTIRPPAPADDTE